MKSKHRSGTFPPMPADPRPDLIDRLLDQWRAARPDLPLGAMEIFARLGRATAIGERLVADELARFGLKLGEFDVLATLRRAGTAQGLTPTDLYRTLMLSSGAITHRLDKLEAAGLIERREDARDRRGSRIALTDQGRALIDEAVTAHVANEERLLAPLSDDEKKSLAATLKKLLASVGG